MKKTLLFAGLFAFSSAINAQTINFNNVVEFGDIIYNSIDNSPAFSMGNTGAGNTWNFAALADDSRDTIEFFHPGNVAGNAATSTFPLATLANQEDTNFVFLRKSPTKLELLGLSNGTIHVASQDPETVITFPSAFGTTFKDTAMTTTTVSGVTVNQPLADSVRIESVTFVESDFDASGTMTTPFGMFSAIRQNLTRTTKTEVYAKGALTGGVYTLISTDTETSNSHQYWSDAANAKSPIVSYEVDATGGFADFVTWTRGFVEFNNVGSKELALKTLKVFPNPVVNTLTIDIEEEINAVIITDITGKVLFRTENQLSNTLTLDFLNKGVYILTIETDSYLGTTKFFKQ
ncbi:MAG: T9SS type A sorting domain-containing protein [Flavobacteriales bacterium]